MIAATILLALAAPDWTRAADAIEAKDGAACRAQFEDAVRVNIRKDMRTRLAPVVAAIRYAENGGKGREYGILHPRVKPTYRSQAGWAAASVQASWDRWVKAGRPGDFITHMQARYCPPEDHPLNRHWAKNVTAYYHKFR